MRLKFLIPMIFAALTWRAVVSAELRGINVDTTATSVQAVLTLNGETHYRLSHLDHPERVVIDLDRTTLAHGARIQRDNDLVASVRTGPRKDGGLRVVLELSRKAQTCMSWDSTSRERRLIISLNDRAGCNRTSPLAPSESIRAVHAPRIDDRPIVIAVDAGHGGEDPGAIGRGGTREKDVTLAIARALAQRINLQPGMRAILTRDSDRFIALRDRILRARRAQADLFVSVHADSIRNADVSGSSVYVLSERGATDEAARWLAERENAADLKGGVKLDDKDNVLASVLLDLSQTANISSSMVAAQRVIHALDQVGEVRKSQVQQAGFVVLKSPDIPSMLVETAYISNPREEQRLRSDRQQHALADAIFGGLRSFFADNPPPGTRLAQAP
jgi:N-acetylmuramoyl-L-alanine amidase